MASKPMYALTTPLFNDSSNADASVYWCTKPRLSSSCRNALVTFVLDGASGGEGASPPAEKPRSIGERACAKHRETALVEAVLPPMKPISGWTVVKTGPFFVCPDCCKGTINEAYLS